MAKGHKRKLPEEIPISTSEISPNLHKSNNSAPKKARWINRTRVLVVPSRGITMRDRHLMNDLIAFMPHAKLDSKKNDKKQLTELNEMAEIKNCTKCIFLENRERLDLYMWLSSIREGPCAKFLIQNIHTKKELKLTGNCLHGSRPLLSFDRNFNEPHWILIKELLLQTFGTPNSHPRSQPFYDHVFTFAILDQRIWFRHYQIVDESGELAEIGPRFVMNPITILDQSFCGKVIWTNDDYESPSSVRSQLKNSELVQKNTTNQNIDTITQASPVKENVGNDVLKSSSLRKRKKMNSQKKKRTEA